MEITDRPDLGGDLRAQKLREDGRKYWSYELVAWTRPGDVVLHWHKSQIGTPALLGWSVVSGPLGDVLYAWTPRAGGRREKVAEPSLNWRQPLGGLHMLDHPITRSDLQVIRSEVLSTLAEVERTEQRPIYAPFYDYGGRELRATQGYLVKFPGRLVDLLDKRFGLELDLAPGGRLPGDASPVADPALTGGQGYQRDAAKQLAIERHALVMAKQFYANLGAQDLRILGKPYDISLTLAGEEVRVEVKGSSGYVDAVLVTRNEVHHARSFDRTELVVVDGIEWTRDNDGEFRTAGGRLRQWKRWIPDDDSLTAMTYSHRLHPTDPAA